MKRKLFSIILLILIAICSLGLVACGGSGSGTGDGSGEGGGIGGGEGGGSGSGVGGGATHPHTLVQRSYTPATCEQDGYQAHWYCSECNLAYFDANGSSVVDMNSIKIAKTGHDLQYVEARDYNCWESGVVAHWYCGNYSGGTLCGKTFSDEEGTSPIADVVLPAGHKIVKVDAVESSCTQAGSKEYFKCSHCWSMYKDQDATQEVYDVAEFKTDKIAHTYDADLLCESCRQHKPNEGFTFDSSNWAINGLGTAADTNLYIPGDAVYEGVEIKKILGLYGDGAENVKTVYIPAGITDIDSSAFNDLINLENFVVDENNPNYKSVDGVLFSKDMTKILRYPIGKEGTSFTIPNTVVSIEKFAFCDCESLTSVDFEEESVLEIIGFCAFEGCKGLTRFDFPASLDVIGSQSFIRSGLITVSIPDTITEWGGSSFNGCENLRWASTGNGVTKVPFDAFSGCEKLYHITLGTNITEIESSAFQHCYALVAIENNSLMQLEAGTIGNGYVAQYVIDIYKSDAFVKPRMVIQDDEYMFYQEISGKWHFIKYLGDSAIVRLPDQVTSVGSTYQVASRAFYGMNFIEQLYIPSTVTEMAQYAIQGCWGLKELTIPFVGKTKNIVGGESVREAKFIHITGELSYGNNEYPDFRKLTVLGGSIPDYAFTNNYMVKEVVLTRDVRSIGVSAFSYAAIEKIDMARNENNGVQSIGENAFQDCQNLTEVYVPWSVTSIGRGAFGNKVSKLTLDCWELDTATSIAFCTPLEVIITNRVTKLPDRIFRDCKVTKLTIEQNSVLVSIGQDAFYNNSTLEAINLPNSLETIGERAFYGCRAITELVIPTRLTVLPTYVFANAVKLGTINIPANIVTIGNGAFASHERLDASVVNSQVINFAVDGDLTTIDENAFIGRNFKTLYLPDSLTTIEYSAFEIGGLNEVSLPFIGKDNTGAQHFGYIFGFNEDNAMNVNYTSTIIIRGGNIDDGAFRNYEGLENLVIDKSVTSIGEGAFENVAKGEKINVYYTGTPTEYSNLTVGTDNDGLISANVYFFSDTEPDYTDGYDYWHYVSGVITVWQQV